VYTILDKFGTLVMINNINNQATLFQVLDFQTCYFLNKVVGSFGKNPKILLWVVVPRTIGHPSEKAYS